MTVRVAGSWPGSAEHVFSTLIKKLKHTCPSTPIADKLFFFLSFFLSLSSLSLPLSLCQAGGIWLFLFLDRVVGQRDWSGGRVAGGLPSHLRRIFGTPKTNCWIVAQSV